MIKQFIRITQCFIIWGGLVTYSVSAAPGSVGNFKVNKTTVTTGTTVTLTWSSTSGATHYNLYAKKPGDTYTRFRANLKSTSTTRYVGKSGTHSLRIQACDASGCGPYSTKNVTAYDAPGTPRTLTSNDYSVSTGTTVNLRWSAPSGYSSPVKYNLEIKKPSDSSYYRRLRNTSATSFNRLIDAAGSHLIRVNACNLAGRCDGFRTITVRATDPSPKKPSFVNAELIENGYQIRVTWANSSDASKMVLEAQVDENGWEPQTISGEERVYFVSNFSVHGSRSYRLKACNGNFCSDYIYAPNSINTQPIPEAPLSFNVSENNLEVGQSVLLSWQNANDSQTLTYNLDIKKPWDDVFFRRLENVSVNQFSRYIGAAGTHQFKVNACNTLGVCGEFATLSLQATSDAQSCDWASPPQARLSEVIVNQPVEFSWDKSRYDSCSFSNSVAHTAATLTPQVCGEKEFHRELLRILQTGQVDTQWTCTIRDTQQQEIKVAPIIVHPLPAPENLNIEDSPN